MYVNIAAILCPFFHHLAFRQEVRDLDAPIGERSRFETRPFTHHKSVSLHSDSRCVLYASTSAYLHTIIPLSRRFAGLSENFGTKLVRGGNAARLHEATMRPVGKYDEDDAAQF